MASRNNQNLQSLQQIVRNNFPTFLLGLTVLLLVILVVSLFAGTGKKTNKQAKSWTQSLTEFFQGPSPTPLPETTKEYVVKEGEDLWHIAEGAYGSGYNAYDIAQANKLENPDLIEVGQVLILPEITAKAPTMGEDAGMTTQKTMSKPATYTVQNGDSLWEIAQNYYGDGYAWVKISQTNNLINPDLLYVGTVLNLP